MTDGHSGTDKTTHVADDNIYWLSIVPVCHIYLLFDVYAYTQHQNVFDLALHDVAIEKDTIIQQ